MFTLIFIVIFLVIYFLLLVIVHQIFLPELDLFRYKKLNKPLTILSIFPHPDDETMAIGGTLTKYSRELGTRITVVSATRGEAGETNNVCSQAELGAQRSQELIAAMGYLGIKDVRFLDLPDGGLDIQVENLTLKVRELLKIIKPDVVITYDQSGLYGHPDHIVLSKVITQLIKSEFSDAKLLFATLPTKLLKRANLPKTINLYGKEVDMQSADLRPTLPKYKSMVWSSTLARREAILAHGFDAYIAKPIDEKAFFITINDVLYGK